MCTIVWDVTMDKEIDNFDHTQRPQVIWDDQGEAYIAEGKETLFIGQLGMRVKSYKNLNENIRKLKKEQKNYKEWKSFGMNFG